MYFASVEINDYKEGVYLKGDFSDQYFCFKAYKNNALYTESFNSNHWDLAYSGGWIKTFGNGITGMYRTLDSATTTVVLFASEDIIPRKKYAYKNIEKILSGKIYSGYHTSLTDTNDGFFMDKDGLSIGSKFKVTADGKLYLGKGATNGTSSLHWTIDGTSTTSYISYNTNYLYYSGTPPTIQPSAGNDQVYIGTDGIRLGTGFAVNNYGTLYAVDGQIGGWVITTNQGGNHILQSTSNGLILNGTTGSITSSAGFTLNSSGLTLSKNGRDALTFNSNGDLKINGTITADDGLIGGWTIDTNGLSNDATTTTGRPTALYPTSITSQNGFFGHLSTRGATLDSPNGGAYFGHTEVDGLSIFDGYQNSIPIYRGLVAYLTEELSVDGLPADRLKLRKCAEAKKYEVHQNSDLSGPVVGYVALSSVW
jgi:hypothetical protein